MTSQPPKYLSGESKLVWYKKLLHYELSFLFQWTKLMKHNLKMNLNRKLCVNLILYQKQIVSLKDYNYFKVFNFSFSSTYLYVSSVLRTL